VARRGKIEEMCFEEEARTWVGISISEKLSRNGDFILAYRDPSGASLEPHLLVDNKNKDAVAESDIVKLVRDAKERTIPVAILVTRDETHFGKPIKKIAAIARMASGYCGRPASGSPVTLMF